MPSPSRTFREPPTEAARATATHGGFGFFFFLSITGDGQGSISSKCSGAHTVRSVSPLSSLAPPGSSQRSVSWTVSPGPPLTPLGLSPRPLTPLPSANPPLVLCMSLCFVLFCVNL